MLQSAQDNSILNPVVFFISTRPKWLVSFFNVLVRFLLKKGTSAGLALKYCYNIHRAGQSWVANTQLNQWTKT